MKRWIDGHMADVETGGRVTKKAGTLYSVLKGALECRFFCDPPPYGARFHMCLGTCYASCTHPRPAPGKIDRFVAMNDHTRHKTYFFNDEPSVVTSLVAPR